MKLTIDVADVLAAGFSEQLNALVEVARERNRQDQKFGDQINTPDLCPILSKGPVTAKQHAEDLEIPTADRARSLCDTAKQNGTNHFGVILVEEVAEAIEQAARRDPAKLRAELIQVAAVAVLWVEVIDRRAAAKQPKRKAKR